jgi:peptide/nickel transport system substrate-binding protein
MKTGTPHRARLWRITAIAAATLMAVTACGSHQPAKTAPTTLHMGLTAPPANLDPAKVGAESLLYVNLAYDPLIYRAPDGTLQPRLATEWKYTDNTNTTFEIKLRQGVKFSDGSALTSAVVKQNIDYYKSTGGQAAPFLAAITNVELPDDLTVRLSLALPVPLLPEIFSQDYLAGNMISPSAIANPTTLATQTDGAGPYELDPSTTVANDHYTYTKNPNYWNPSDVGFESVTVKVLPNENTALTALRSGQVDVINGTYGIAAAAASAGMKVAASPNIVVGIQLNDRSGKLSPPLADQRVRQAINFGIDRAAITKALLGDYGLPTDQPAAPGGDGWSDPPFYSYDPTRAKQLLGDAGYSGGFDLPVIISTDPFSANVVQAMADQLKDIGVRVKITAMDPAKGIAQLADYPASVMGWGVQPVYIMGRGLWLGAAVGMNPFHSSDAQLEALDQQAAIADAATRAQLDQQIVRRVVELGWFVPVTLTPVFLFYRNTITLNAVQDRPLPAPVAWRPA